MRDSRPQTLDDLLNNEPDAEKSVLLKVKEKVFALHKINREVTMLLPAQLHPWCRVANYRYNVLVLETASASWRMRLYYEQSHLLSALRARILPSLSSIDIKINPALMAARSNFEKTGAKIQQDSENPASLRQLSQESAAELRALALRCPEKLRYLLEKLAALAKKDTDTGKSNQ